MSITLSSLTDHQSWLDEARSMPTVENIDQDLQQLQGDTGK